MPALNDLRLELFEDDGETVAWEVGTATDHAAPYLADPDRYEEQEIDAASCAASIGTISVTVIDPAIIPGDQDGGWMTARLAELGIPAVAGRRARLRRWDGTTWRRIADGPAGAPRLQASYAAYGWEIRDWRETERKLRAFDQALGRVLIPEGFETGYGYDPGDATYLLPIAPVIRANAYDLRHAGLYDQSVGLIYTAPLIDMTGRRDATRQALLGETDGQEVMVWHDDGYPAWGSWTEYVWRTRYAGRLAFRWRLHAGPGAWHYIPPENLFGGGRTVSPPDGDPMSPEPPDYINSGAIVSATQDSDTFDPTPFPDTVEFGFWVGDDRAVPDLPTGGSPFTDIDFQVLAAAIRPSKDHPTVLEGLTAGQFLQNLYDGLYSVRDENGDVVATGIRYEAAALDQMTDPIRLRLTEPIDDVRDWAEKYIYPVTGWIPALNAAGEISPVRQAAPSDTSGLAAVDDTNAEPQPDWDAGDRIVNDVKVTYPRDYIPTDPANAETGDGLRARDVVDEFEDPLSLQRHGSQPLELDGRAFRALGLPSGEAKTVIGAETAWQLASARGTALLARYAFGAPAFRVNAMRAALPDLRAGEYVIASLSWLPDYITGRRGLLTLCQVMSIGDLNPAWRGLLLERVAPPGS